MLIAIVYDNYGCDPRLRIGSGFACLVKTTITILFDTGAHGPTLLYNMEKLGFPPEEIDAIVLSHIDNDHVGGLFKLLERNWETVVYALRSFPTAFKDLIITYGAKVVEVDEPGEICPGVMTSGELGTWLKEQSLILKTEEGVIVIVGDAHPGIVSVIQRAEEIARGKVSLVIGGFHLDGLPVSEIKSIVESFKGLGVGKVAPCHSSGDMALKLFREEYRENYIESGVGRVINYP